MLLIGPLSVIDCERGGALVKITKVGVAFNIYTVITVGSLRQSASAHNPSRSRAGAPDARPRFPPAVGAYDAGNQLASFNGTHVTIDSSGSLLFDPSLHANYTWNERGQLASASVGGIESSFTYDALGRYFLRMK